MLQLPGCLADGVTHLCLQLSQLPLGSLHTKMPYAITMIEPQIHPERLQAVEKSHSLKRICEYVSTRFSYMAAGTKQLELLSRTSKHLENILQGAHELINCKFGIFRAVL